ncbi:hypothetical protein FEM48_Zijuj03G0043300 [Ziziphus jujuba var. spinosa]|uniref:DUF4219 domain-containing protein n=1 Tax=Ziziphus jujuba var. spinosa TaxID=714518 RepID=A0A978VN53_ZIZJJ|nr:hypothetical protein FEM48_Zijuj03G0043300 [Ziziphus jujuba var. spinosa]
MLTDDQRSMSATNGAVLSTEIVPEVLINKENYREWSFRLRTYLMAQDVWDVVEPTPTFVDVWDVALEMAWKRKNATALHAIHISCGPYAFSLIEGITKAKEAWDKLAELMDPLTFIAGPEPLIQAAIQGILKDSTAAINHILTELQNQSIHTDEGSTTVSAVVTV